MLENTDPKTNPKTTIPGIAFTLISVLMYCIKYVLPAFITLKEEIPYTWWEPLAPLGLGLLMLFMNDKIFERIFNRADKVVSKVTHTEETTITDKKE